VLPLYAEQFGASELVNGLLIGVFSLMVMIASPLWGKLSDRVGRRPVLIFSVLGSAVGYFIMGWGNSIFWLFVARIIDGASGGNVATAQAYIADITTPEQRSKAMGMIGAAFGLGFIIGPAVGGLLAGWSPHAPFYFVGVLCVINAVMVYTSLPESLSLEKRKISHTEQPLSELLSHADSAIFVRVALCYFVCLAAFSIMTAIFSLFGLHRFELDARHMSYIMALIGIIAVIMQGGVIRRLLPKYGEVKLARVGMAILLISFVLLPLTGHSEKVALVLPAADNFWAKLTVSPQHSLAALLIVSSLIAVGNSLVQPTLNGLASRSVEASWQGRAMGLLQSAASLGRGIGPIIGGVLLHMDVTKDDKPLASYGRTPFWVAAVFMLITLVLAAGLRLPTRGTAPIAEEEASTSPAAEI
jgi:multidrug resistance protein